MNSEKKWMAVVVEIDTYDGEVQSVLPIEAETSGYFTHDELEKIYRYMREADDASFDFMWDFRAMIAKERDALES